MRYLKYILIFSLLFNSCVKDDIVQDRQDEILRFVSENITALAVAETHQFETRYTNNIGVVLTPEITWESSNEAIIALSSTGLATALAPGTAVVTASTVTEDGVVVAANQTLNVTAADETIVINNVIQELIISTSHQYQTTYTNQLGEVDNTINVTWSSSNPAAITVSQDGLITGVNSGQATIAASVTLENQDVITVEDVVTVVALEERLSINNPTETLDVDETYQYSINYTNNIGETNNDIEVTWTSSDSTVLSVNANGVATAINGGTATITASVTSSTGNTIIDTDDVTVNAEAIQVRTGQIVTTTFYVLEGEFTLREIPNTNDLELIIDDSYRATTRLPGLYLYLTNNTQSIANAKEVGAVTVFEGAHSYIIRDTAINDFTHLFYWCKPIGVAVGEGEIN